MLWFTVLFGPIVFGFLHYNFGQQPWLLNMANNDPVFAYLLTVIFYYTVLGSVYLLRWCIARRTKTILR